MTAYDTSELSERLQQLKVQEVITKPVNPERISQIVMQALEEMKQAKSVNPEPALQEVSTLDPAVENVSEERGNNVTVETEMERSIQGK